MGGLPAVSGGAPVRTWDRDAHCGDDQSLVKTVSTAHARRRRRLRPRPAVGRVRLDLGGSSFGDSPTPSWTSPEAGGPQVRLVRLCRYDCLGTAPGTRHRRPQRLPRDPPPGPVPPGDEICSHRPGVFTIVIASFRRRQVVRRRWASAAQRLDAKRVPRWPRLLSIRWG